MDDTTALTITEVADIAERFSKSKLFATKTPEEAFVQIMAGQEIGIPAFAAMTGIHVIQGKATLGAGIIASRIKASGKYDYRVTRQDNTGCVIVFSQGEEQIGISSFTDDDAKAAGVLGKDNWKKYPRNMYFARAISNGARWYTPDVFSGSVYIPEEIGGKDVDIIDVMPKLVDPGHMDKLDAPKAESEQPDDESEPDDEMFIGIPAKRNHFWATATEMGLDNDQVHLILGIESMYDYDGTEEKALATLRDYLDSQPEQEAML